MRAKTILYLLVPVVISACSKSNEVPGSASIIGSWKFESSYYVTIAGTKITQADAAKPVILNFNNTLYSTTVAGKLTTGGNYTLLDKYQYAPGYYITNVLELDSIIAGKYAIHRGNPDTLSISDINPGPDNGFGATYLRVK
ncbi:hypothetical protein [Mucilaginibacter jinjuensis]|uniref:Lipocalin-like protein n=1 Tax=Mucilaginibacter jinjuensis TaxID=1176721 RepID=A0ABY7TGF7_9SPHI|nr:hypothetical protein [Mucilaginibacter jinjuensis]WCT14667.1 hypothetical protein PQO05_12040 [Mucilaginibacter jinjuensis]